MEMTMQAKPKTGDERLASLQDRHERARNFALELAAMAGRERDPARLASLQERRKDLEWQVARLESDIEDWTG